MNEVSKEYEEGRSARAKGLPDSANLYEAGSQQSLDWLAGYTADEADTPVPHDDPAT